MSGKSKHFIYLDANNLSMSTIFICGLCDEDALNSSSREASNKARHKLAPLFQLFISRGAARQDDRGLLDVLEMSLQILDVLLEWLWQEAKLLNISDMLIPQSLRADVDGEICWVGVPVAVKETTLPADFDRQVDDEVTGDSESIDGQNLSKAFYYFCFQAKLLYCIQIWASKKGNTWAPSKLALHVIFEELRLKGLCLVLLDVRASSLLSDNSFLDDSSCLLICDLLIFITKLWT